MWNNLIISYELVESSADQSELTKAIQDLGNCTKLHSTCWYVCSPHSASLAAKRLSAVLNKRDILIIADTTNDSSVWHNLTPTQSMRVRQNWRLNKSPKGSKPTKRATHPAGNA